MKQTERTPVERFTSALEYCEGPLLDAATCEYDDPSLEKTVTNKLMNLRHFVVRTLGFFARDHRVPPSDWIDLCPTFNKGILAFMASSLDFPNDQVPEAAAAIDAFQSRREQLVHKGYWSDEEIWSWSEPKT